MKLFIQYPIVGLVCVIAGSACKQDQYPIFNDNARLQFGPPISNSVSVNEFTDSAKTATFYYAADHVSRDTIYFDIYTIGGISKEDRLYTLQQMMLPGLENAVPGKHFIPFDDPTISGLYVIKADSVRARVPVVLLRDSELKNKTVHLGISIVENRNFSVGETKKSWRKLQFTDRLTQPVAWTDFYSRFYFGAYSVRKHEFMIDVTGQPWNQYFMEAQSEDQLIYYKSVFGMALVDYNNEHPTAPLRAENGDLILFP